MISMLGIGLEAQLACREKYVLTEKKQQDILSRAASSGGELVIVATCNRTEIYFCGLTAEQVLTLCGWEKSESLQLLDNPAAVTHLFRLACGFLSAVPGEDQISGQLRDALHLAEKINSSGRNLNRLFQLALYCGRQFRKAVRGRLQPYSLLSIVKQIALEKKCRTFTIAGYGKFGQLAAKYLLSAEIDTIYVLSRTLRKVEHPQIKIADYKDKRSVLAQSDCLISVTSAPHHLFHPEDFCRPLLAFDLAVPRDIDPEVQKLGVTLYDVDSLIGLQQNYLAERLEIMQNFSDIAEDFIRDFILWQAQEEIKPFISDLNRQGAALYELKKKYYSRKMNFQDQQELTDGLLKSTSQAFIRRAVEVLKEEHQAGRGRECQELLSRIFQI